MRFKYHYRCNYPDITEKQYYNYQKQYFRHLLKINFTRNASLLKYFGTEFFHDSSLINFEHDVNKKIIRIQIIREEADLFDINKFRNNYRLEKISLSNYLRNPIAYNFLFTEIKDLTYKITNEYLNNLLIMDSEIIKTNKPFKLTIYQDESNYIEFKFISCRFKEIPTNSIKYYTNNKSIKMPYCEHCKGMLLDKKKLTLMVNNK